MRCAHPTSFSDSNPSTIFSWGDIVDKERDAEFIANGSMEEIGKIWASVSPDSAIKDDEKDTDEVKQLKQKRRSTIIQAKSWREMDFSNLLNPPLFSICLLELPHYTW